MSLTIIYKIIFQFGQPTCAHPLILIFLNPLQRAALHPSFICNLAFAWWHFCFCRMLPSGVSFEIALPTKIHPLKHHNKKLLCIKCNAFCEKSTSFPGICYLADFIDTAHTIRNFARRIKLFFFSKKRSNISKILSWYLSKCQSSWYSPDIEQSKIYCFQASNILR